jgi:hypothetical protein
MSAMALDARTRTSIYRSLAPVIGEENANALMSEFPSVEADELVTKQFLRAELAQLRTEMSERFQRQTAWLAGTVLASAAMVIAAIPLLS